MRITIIFLLFLISNASAQDDSTYFAAPLDIPMVLSGNFAELRSNHFHTGIDIKTQGVTGKNVLAAADGVVSRIAVSPYGYGRALYIDHPNGQTTVYGHIERFTGKIADAVRAEQYRLESFNVDFSPEDEIRVSRGEVVAKSGNSGSSGGPHLHFEIRDTESEHPLNPLKFGFDIEDNLPPRIRGIRFHPLSDTTLINGVNKAKSFIVVGGSGSYSVRAGQDISVYGAFGISVHTLDYLNGAPNKCGVYDLELHVNDELICKTVFDELDFSTVRHINSYKDYEVYKTNRWHYHKSFVDPGNQLEIYSGEMDGNGVIHIPENKTNTGIYSLKDAYGNKSELKFNFETVDKPNGKLPTVKPYDAYFHFDRDNDFAYADELEIAIPAGALYRDLRFNFGREMPGDEHYSAIFTIQNEYIPLQKPAELKFNISNVSANLRSKLLVVHYNPQDARSYITGSVEGNFYVAKIKEFGRVALITDSEAPELKASKWSGGGTVNDQSMLYFYVSDNTSGLASYKAFLNGSWTLSEYDYKNGRIEIGVGEAEFQKGENTLRVLVEDGCGNSTEREFKYNY